MKRITLLAMIMLACNLSAEVWGFEDFESGSLDGTTLYDFDGDANNWEITTANPYSGVYAIRSVSSALTPNNMIVSPQIYVERYEDNFPYLKLMIGAEDPVNYAEHFEILISFTDTDSASFIQIHEETLTSSEWKEINIDLGPYMSDSMWSADIYIGIRHFDSDGQSALLLDNFMLYSIPEFFFEDSQYIEGTIAPYSEIFTEWFIVDMSMYDESSGDYVGFEDATIYYILNDGVTYQPVDSIALMIDTDNETYKGTMPGQPMGTFIEYWAVVVDNSGHSIVSESSHLFAEWGEVNFDEGFESGGALPEGWSTFCTGNLVSDWDYKWEANVTSNVHSGSYSITSASQNNFGVYDTEDYLVSPKLSINGESKLKYYINPETPEGYTEEYVVFISIAGGDSATIVNTVDTLFTEKIIAGVDDDVWYERIIDLEPWDGQFIWLAFKHVHTPVDKKLDRFINIDDISVSELPIVTLGDFGNSCLPNDPFELTLTATDYSGIESSKLFYSIDGGVEVEVVMTDNGDDTYTGSIPGQVLDTKAAWYIVVTDDSEYHNVTSSETYDIIWFARNWIEWGTTPGVYPDLEDGNGTPWIAAIDWNFGNKEDLYLNKIEAGFKHNETVTWKLVEFDGVPTDKVIGTLEGVVNFNAGKDVFNVPTNPTKIYGHVALALEINGGYLYLDESADKTHAWQYTASQGWQNNKWGMFHIRMFVSNDSTGIGTGEFIANTTELCQNYPNPFNPTTSISFFNVETGKVNLTVYNVAGEKVVSLVDDSLEKGYHKINFDASQINSGVYYYTLTTPEARITKKMVLIK